MINLRLGYVALIAFLPSCMTTYEFPVQVLREPAIGLQSLSLSHHVGAIRILAADVKDIEIRTHPRVRALSRSRAEGILDGTELVTKRNGGELEVRWSPSNWRPEGFAADLDISLPSDLALTIRSKVGDVEVLGLDAPLQITLAVGDIDVRESRCSRLEAHVAIGDITVDADLAWIKLTGDVGDVEATVGPGLREAQLQTDIGDVVLSVPEGMPAHVLDATTDLGHVAVPRTDYSGESSGHDSPRIHLQSSTGDVAMRRNHKTWPSRFD